MTLKRLMSIVLTLCFVFSAFAFATVENVSLKVSAAVGYSVTGESKATADFIIDPGHGGNDPGALSTVLGYDRHEADDTLRMSLAVAKLLEQSGSSAALTRATDMTQPLENRTGISNGGNYKYFISLHRNACGTANLANGVETYYYNALSSTSNSAKLANSVQNAIIGTGVWGNRYVKTSTFYVIRLTNIPAVLVELGFMDNHNDNLKFDQYFDVTSKAVANGLLAMIGKSVNAISAPSISVDSSIEYNAATTVSWGAISNATSYSYKAELYQGEPSATTATTIASSTSTTATSFTIPAQTSGKYIKITVTATGSSGSAEATKTITLGKSASYPTNVEYIPVAELNAGVGTSNSTIWTASKGSAFTAVYWKAMLCSPNNDGTYTVDSVYESGSSKSVTASGKNIVFAIHSAYTNFDKAEKIVAGDKLTFVGVYLDNNVVYDNAHVLVNGGISLSVTAPVVSCPAELEAGSTCTVSWAAVSNATSYSYKVTLDNNGVTSVVVEKTDVTEKTFTIPAVNEGTSLTVTVTAVGPLDSKTTTKTITLKVTVPTDITSSSVDIVKVGDNSAFRGFVAFSTVQDTLAMFDQDNSFLVIFDSEGNEKAADEIIATGCTVNIVVDGTVKVSYDIVVAGDIDGDSDINAADYITMAKTIKQQVSLDGAYALAADFDGNGSVDSSDYISLAKALKS